MRKLILISLWLGFSLAAKAYRTPSLVLLNKVSAHITPLHSKEVHSMTGVLTIKSVNNFQRETEVTVTTFCFGKNVRKADEVRSGVEVGIRK